MEKQNLFLWSLYDFANSVVYISFLLYFAQWLVIDGGLSDFWYNALFAIATVLLLFSAPLLAARVDKHQTGGKLFLNLATIGTLVGYGCAALFAYSGTANMVPAAVAFVFGQYFYQLSFVFYTPMLAQLSDGGQRVLASGIGQFANALGQVSGVLIARPFASTRRGPLAPSLRLFFVLALPMMIFFKERHAHIDTQLSLTNRGFFKKLTMFVVGSAAAPLLFAYFFFNDAIITLSNNYAIVLERVYAAPDTYKSLLLLAILVLSAIGGVIAGFIGRRVGSYKTLVGIVCGWVVMLPLLALAPTFAIFAALTLPVGLLIGSAYATSRVYMTELLAPHELNYGFSFYTLFERFASIAGPLTWGLTLLVLGNDASTYRVAITLMGALIAIGLCILLFWRRVQTSNL
ncbi:MAG: MFS transporter [Patescibacteria group bacterium]